LRLQGLLHPSCLRGPSVLLCLLLPEHLLHQPCLESQSIRLCLRILPHLKGQLDQSCPLVQLILLNLLRLQARLVLLRLRRQSQLRKDPSDPLYRQNKSN